MRASKATCGATHRCWLWSAGRLDALRVRPFASASAGEQKRDWDLASAAEVLFSRNATSGPHKKLGLDWHLWQFATALLPVGAAYGVAMYSRGEQAKVKELGEKAAALEKSAAQKAPSAEPTAELEEVVQRLRALEARLDAAELSRPHSQAVPVAQPAGAKQ